jgi:hypothetical protein
LIFHIQKEKVGPFNPECNGGHSLHIGAFEDGNGNLHPYPTNISITMKDYVAIDDDGDGLKDEDKLDGVNNDNDCTDLATQTQHYFGDPTDGIADNCYDATNTIRGDRLELIDEDPIEPNFETFATDCDSRAPSDNEVGIQIGDKDPDKGQITLQSWWLRLVGKPRQAFNFTTKANHTVSCTLVDPGADGIAGTADDILECSSNIVELDNIDIREGGDCVQAYKKGGKAAQGGGKTSFCDITSSFLVDYDSDGDGTIDNTNGEHIFSLTCNATYGVSTDEDPLENPADDQDGDGLDGEDPVNGGVNDDNDCTDSATQTLHFIGDPTDGVLDDCYDATNTVRGDRLELIDEDPLDGLDNDGDGLNGEDPVDGIDNDGDETGEFCPLGGAIWDVDQSSGRPTIQVFVIHDTFDVSIKQTGKVRDHKGGPFD